MGLGTGSLSLANQFAQRFSYCLGNISDPSYDYNYLILGDGAQLLGHSTPYEVSGQHYDVTIEGINIGEKKIDLDPNVFANKNDSGLVLIDSGSESTYLADKAFSSLANEVRSRMDGLLTETRYYIKKTAVCYNGVVTRDLAGFPLVTFKFAGGAQMSDDIFCMTVYPSSNARVSFSIIGVGAQQNYNVGYDLDKKLIYFLKTDCELMID